MCVCDAGYAPIRFKGNTKVNINLGYDFFFDTVVPSMPMGGVETGVENDGSQGREPERRRKRREVGGAEQGEKVVELTFRMAEVRSGILLYSQTSQSSHLIRVSSE